MMKKRNLSVIIASILLVLIMLIIISMCIGKYEVSPLECLSILFNLNHNSSEMTVNVVWGLRLPRILGAILVGVAFFSYVIYTVYRA